MEQTSIYNQTFDRVDYTENPLQKGEYEKCRFINCNFSNTSLSDIKFIDCQFTSCNLSLAALEKTAFRDIEFIGCKMLGLRFDQCNPFGLAFIVKDCILNHSSFYRMK